MADSTVERGANQDHALLPNFDRNVWFMLSGIFVGSIGTHIVGSFLVLFLTLEARFSPTKAGLAFSLVGAAVICGQLSVVSLAGRWGRRNAFIFSLLLEVIAAGIIVVLRFEIGLFVGVSLLGFSWGAEQVSGNSFFGDLVEEGSQIEAYSWQRAVYNLAGVFGPPLGGLAFGLSGRLVMVIDGLVTLIFALIIYFAVKASAARTDESDSQNTHTKFGQVLRDYWFVIFSATTILTWMGFSQTKTTLPIYLTAGLGFSPQVIGVMYGLMSLVSTIGQIIVSRVLRRIAYQLIPVIAVVGYVAGFAGLVAFRDVVLIMLSVLALYVGDLLLAPAANALTARRATSDLRPGYFAVLSLGYSAGITLGPVLGGVLLERGTGSAVWLGCLGLMIVSGLGFGLTSFKLRLSKED